MQTEVRGDPRLGARDAARVRPAQAEVEFRELEVPEEILAHERREEEEPHGVGQTSPRVTIGVSFRSRVEAPNRYVGRRGPTAAQGCTRGRVRMQAATTATMRPRSTGIVWVADRVADRRSLRRFVSCVLRGG